MTNSLYRFRPLNNNTFDELTKSYLYFSTIDKLNDPMECFYKLFFNESAVLYEILFQHFLRTMHLIDIEFKLNDKETFKENIVKKVFKIDGKMFEHLNFDKWVKENLKDIIKEYENKEIWESRFKKILMQIYNSFYGSDNKAKTRVTTYTRQLKKLVLAELLVCCFYKPNNDVIRGYKLNDEEILMWAHYAGGHSGICMGFDDIVPQDNELQSKLKHRKIEYKDDDTKTLKFSVGLAASGNIRLELKGLQDIYNNKYEAIYNTKLKAWEYEKEYRYSIRKDDLPNQRLKYKIECLKSIIFGVNTPQDERDKIKTIIETKCRETNHRVNFYEVEITNNGIFEIDECGF